MCSLDVAVRKRDADVKTSDIENERRRNGTGAKDRQGDKEQQVEQTRRPGERELDRETCSI
jgi:hypothetical protein